MLEALNSSFSDIDFAADSMLYHGETASGQTLVRVPVERLIEVLTFLKDDPRTAAEQLCDLTCVDYLDFPGATSRFGVTYSLTSISLGHRLWVRCFVDEPNLTVPSACSLWSAADWLEREVYDLFGIQSVSPIIVK